ncbi:hypothetical protein ATI61_106441 [Archangium gephyra]|uniref:Uncharacterized protein n=1 Tax=Archangium gephyra TaxID=48 RepID=A0AAC8Q127_9BACT|nr:hypothetical protein [Archangium gephyra]AKI99064.1 Hypothetical protein AA314_00691 [Archangium gephyra]REG30971.1 hypothetical protein ATI61_106441 [Archangium gephyra]
MKVGTKVMWLAVVVGILMATSAVLVQHWSPGSTALMSLGLVLAQLAALILPLHRSRELTTGSKAVRAPEARSARPSSRS